MPNLNDWIGTQPAAPSGATTDPLRLTQGQSQPSYLDRYMQDRQKRVEEIDQMSPIRRFFGPNAERQDLMLELVRGEDMKRKQGATQVQAEAELRKQQAEMQKQGRDARTFIFDKLAKLESLPPDKRSSVAPVYAELIGDMLDMSGAKNASQIKKLVTAAFNNPATGKLLRSQMADSAYEEHDFQEITDQLGLQDEAQWTSVFDKKRAAKVKEYERTISVALPQFVARLKAKGVAAPTPGDLMTHAEGALGELGKSAIVREAYVNVVNGMTPQQQSAIGLTPGTIELTRQETEARELGGLTPAVTKGKADQQAAITEATELAKLKPAVLKAQLDAKTAETEAVEGIKAKYAKPVQAQNLASTMRDDFLKMPSVKNAELAIGAFGQIEEAYTGPHTPASDWAILVGYAKINDPDSVAREGEQAAVRKLAAVDEKVANAYDLFIKKKLFPPETRKEIFEASQRLVGSRIKTVRGIETQFTDIAKRQGVNPADVVVDVAGRYRGLSDTKADDPVSTLHNELKTRGPKKR